MKSLVCLCVLFHLFNVNNAQFGGMFGRSNPFFGGWGGFPMLDPFTAALFFGFDYNELMALQALTGQSRSIRPGAQNQAMRDIEALSALGLIDGPDAPDGRGAAGGKKKAGGGGAGPARAARPQARGGGGEAESRPAGPRRNGPRRRNRNRRQ